MFVQLEHRKWKGENKKMIRGGDGIILYILLDRVSIQYFL